MSPSDPAARPSVLEPGDRATYRSQGYVVLRQVVPTSFLEGAQDLLERLVDDRIAQWLRDGLLDDGFDSLDFGHRYHAAWLAAGRPRGTDGGDDARFSTLADETLLRQPWLLGLAGDALGSDHPTPMVGCLYRAKFPDDDRSNIPWHQDVQCARPVSGDEDFVTIWMPFGCAGASTACVEVSPVGPEQTMFDPVWSARSDYVCMDDPDVAGLAEPAPIDLQRGDALLMSPVLPHRSIGNTGDAIRWSLDLRYRPTAVPTGGVGSGRGPGGVEGGRRR